MYLLITLLTLSQLGTHPPELPGDVGYQIQQLDVPRESAEWHYRAGVLYQSGWLIDYSAYPESSPEYVMRPWRTDTGEAPMRDGWIHIQIAADAGHVKAAALIGLRNVHDPETLPYLAYAARHGVIKACLGMSQVYAESDPYSALVWALIARREHPRRKIPNMSALTATLSPEQVANAKAQAAAFVFG
jgi:hypothetical protein